jgi:hypothetical protein
MSPAANSDGLINWLPQRQGSLVRGPEGHLTKLTGKVWARTLFFLLSDHQNEMHCTLYQISAHSLLPFTGTTLALSADALVPRFLLAPRLFRRDTKLYCRLSGFGTVSRLHRDPKLTTVYRDWQKTRQP